MPWFYYGKTRCYSGYVRWHPGDSLSRHSYVSVFSGIENNNNGLEP